MELLHTAALTSRARPPSLLVSLHDVSPLTLAESHDAIAMLGQLGLPPSVLTVFVIPRHEGRLTVDEHEETKIFLHGLIAAGAHLVMHGLTHRMTGRAWMPMAFLRAHVFARGQGELLRTNREETSARIDEGRAILRRAGLDEATRGFLAPAWLLSDEARAAVRGANFEFHEEFTGIVHQERRHARRVVGWGSLGAAEAWATAAFARLQCALPLVDTRVAVHPMDMRRRSQRRAIGKVIASFASRMRAQSYAAYLGLAPKHSTTSGPVRTCSNAAFR